ncbi:MAG: substrate-binding domain-containing protein [Actinobacteria bacterium]|nr:substrate-binding domain-containing protein [Actinomycetota bacterium]
MKRGRWKSVLAASVLAAVLASVAATASSAGRPTGVAASKNHTVKVGVIYSRSGLLSAYGAEYIQGLRLGLRYVTKGTNTVKGHKIEFTLVDDAGDPAKAVSAAKDLIGQGYKIIAGTVSSGVALQLAPLAQQNKVLYISGPAASDAITGLNRNTFRSGRQTYQDVLTAASFLGKDVGRKIVVFAQDTAFGQGNFVAVNAVLGGKGHTVSRTLVPLSATDFTPFAQQVKNARPDLLFVAWAGTTAPAMWRALDQQGVFDATKVVTGLAERATWTTFGDAATKIQFLSHYVYTAPKNPVNDWLVKTMRRSGRGQLPDLFTPDGFAAAQMIARAVDQGGGNDVDKMISALEGWQFLAPKGKQRIRPQDHAMTQPMFQVRLQKSGSRFVPVVLKTVSAGNTQPPLRNFP